MKIVEEYIAMNPNAGSNEVGDVINNKIGFSWAPSSQTRYGNGLLRWHRWLKSAK
jgi:hypothetical protein